MDLCPAGVPDVKHFGPADPDMRTWTWWRERRRDGYAGELRLGNDLGAQETAKRSQIGTIQQPARPGIGNDIDVIITVSL